MSSGRALHLYVAPRLDAVGHLEDDRLAQATERHRFALATPVLRPCTDVLGALAAGPAVAGVVLGLERGFLDGPQLRLAERLLAAGHRLLAHWPAESAIEVVDAARLVLHRRLARLFRLFGTPACADERPVPGALAPPALATGDPDKDAAQRQWDADPVGPRYVKRAAPHTLDWFLEIERHRYGAYAPWMPKLMEFALHGGQDVLEIGGGVGTDLAQFARHGARVTDIDLSAGHLALAREGFRLRGLDATFVHHDAESLPFPDGRFDLVYSHGVIHHTPHPERLLSEARRVLRPGGRIIVMAYAQRSWHHWWWQVGHHGLRNGLLAHWSMGEILSRHAEASPSGGRPLVKVYTRARLRELFVGFADVQLWQRQLTAPELPLLLRPLRPWLEPGLGWNLIVKARKAAADVRD